MMPRDPQPVPRASSSECDQNYIKTRHTVSYCHNLPPSCFESGKNDRTYTIRLLRDISDLPVSIEPASSLVTVDSVLRLSGFDGPFYEMVLVAKQVEKSAAYFTPLLRILWNRERVRLITLDNGPKSELTLPLPGSIGEIQQSRMDILMSQAMRNISVAFRLGTDGRATDTTFITPPVSGSIELMYREIVDDVEICGRRFLPSWGPEQPDLTSQWKAELALPTEDQIRRSSLPRYGDTFWMFVCLMGLLTTVVYFYLEATGFMLSKIARGKRRRRPPPRRKRGKQQYLTEMAIFRDVPIQTQESWVCSHGGQNVQQELVLLRDIGAQTDEIGIERTWAHQDDGSSMQETDLAPETAAEGKSDKASGRAETVSRPSQTRHSKK
ncbi:hypothetical protein AAHC03_021141 [Spirometra sp. Aus1]